MAYQSGTAGSVAFVSGGTPLIAGAYSWSLNIGQETPEVTAFGVSWKEFLPGIREWDGTIEMIDDTTGGAAGTVKSLIVGGSAAIIFQFYEGAKYWAGSAYVSGGAPEISYDDKAVISFDLQGHGPLTYV